MACRLHGCFLMPADFANHTVTSPFCSFVMISFGKTYRVPCASCKGPPLSQVNNDNISRGWCCAGEISRTRLEHEHGVFLVPQWLSDSRTVAHRRQWVWDRLKTDLGVSVSNQSFNRCQTMMVESSSSIASWHVFTVDEPVGIGPLLTVWCR